MRSTTLDRLIACRSIHRAERWHLTFVQEGDELVGYDRNHRAQEWRRAAGGALIYRAPTRAEREEMEREHEEWRKRQPHWLLVVLGWGFLIALGFQVVKRTTEG